MSRIITLLTDFGIKDNYSSVMKGVILKINNNVDIIDISHEIGRHSIDEAAFLIYSSYKYFPSGTIHVIVVDPEVGSDRKILGVKTPEYIFLAPDNGVLKFVYDELESDVYSVSESKYYLTEKISNTFHGRDIFAPVAAHISMGVKLESLGEKIEQFNRGNLPFLKITEEFIEGEIIYIDKFGNAVTNIKSDSYSKRKVISVSVKDLNIKDFRKTFSSVETGKEVVYTGSADFLELAGNRINLAKNKNISIGDRVVVNF